MISSRVHALFSSMPSLLSISPVLLFAAGCAAGGHDARESSAVEPVPAKAGAEASKEGDEKPDKKEKLEKKEHELACAKIELDIAKQSTDAESRAARVALVEAEFRFKRATEDRDNYKNVESGLITSDTDLHLSEAKERLEESRQELAELEKMYSKEKFAEITKELVLVRGKVKVQMAQKGLDIAQKRATQQIDFEIPKKSKELDQAVEKTQSELDAARQKEARVANENKLKLMKAEQAIDEIERAIAKLKSQKDEKEAKS